jgi:hypothetical protein
LPDVSRSVIRVAACESVHGTRASVSIPKSHQCAAHLLRTSAARDTSNQGF